jgi:hypothetical protein
MQQDRQEDRQEDGQEMRDLLARMSFVIAESHSE